MILNEFVKLEEENGLYVVHGDKANIKLYFLTEDIVRIRVSFDRKFTERSYSLITTCWEDELDDLFVDERNKIQPISVDVVENENEVIFKTKKLTFILNKTPLHFTVKDENGNILYEDVEVRAFEQDHLGRVFHYNKIDEKNDHFFGFGEQTGALNKMGQRMTLSPKDAIGHDPEYGGPLYKHIPFYIRLNSLNQSAFGLFYHNSYDSTFDIGKEISGYWPRYSYYSSDGGDIDFFFINGPDVMDVIERYTVLTGKQALPPKQTLGYTASTMYYAELEEKNDEEIYKVIEKHFDEEMHIDNFKLASGYSAGEEENFRYTFNWNKKRFPNPVKFFETMNEKGVNVIPNLKPGILAEHPYMDEFDANQVFVKTNDEANDYIGRWWGGEGKFVDFTNPKGRQVWKELLKETILRKGTISIWNDNCEYDGIEDKTAICDYDGKKGEIKFLKPLQSNMMAYTAKEATKEVYPNKRPYIISRSGFAGIQRYAQTWAGDNLTDWRTIKYNIATILGMGLSGVANTGCDIGGFAGRAPEGELLLRWIQNGIFQPRFCINSANNDNSVTQPWMHEDFNDSIRKAYKKRYEMLPYLYSLMYEAHKTAKPIMRPLFTEFQQDVNSYNDEHFTFMFGPSILVANVVDKSVKTRKVYLPAGEKWYDMSDNLKAYEGGQEIEIPVDYDSIPMFLRESGLFITTQDVKNIKNDKLESLHILVGEGENKAFDYYDDDGDSLEFNEGVYEKISISTHNENNQKKIKFINNGSYTSELKKFELKVLNKENGAMWVSVADERLPRYLNASQWASKNEGWYYNASDGSVQVKFDRPNLEQFDVIVSTEQFDLIGMGLTKTYS